MIDTSNIAPQKKAFIEALAHYLVDGQARRSIELEMGKEAAKEWAKLRHQTPLFGYPTFEEAYAQLVTFLC